MAGIKHTFVSAIADDAVPGGKVQPSHWNATHDLSAFTLGDLPRAARPLWGGSGFGAIATQAGAFATRGVVFRPDVNMDVDTAFAQLVGNAGGTLTWLAQISTATITTSGSAVTAVTVGTVLATTPVVTSEANSAALTYAFPFSSPVALTAGQAYLLSFSNSTGATTTALPSHTGATNTTSRMLGPVLPYRGVAMFTSILLTGGEVAGSVTSGANTMTAWATGRLA